MEINKRNNLIKKTLFGLILSVVTVSLIQQNFNLVKLKMLNGSFQVAEKPILTLKGWLEGVYQTKQETYFDQNFGFRKTAIRFYNQWNYTLFNQAKANGVIIGKEGYLYEENYIKAHLGLDFLGEEVIKNHTERLKKVREKLLKKNINLLVIFAPGKASFYPEYIPDKYHPEIKKTTNLEAYRAQMILQGIPFLDLNSYFIDLKKSSPFPLYPKTGIHWSKYGEIIASDTLIKYLEQQNRISLAKIQVERIENSTNMRDTDDDIEKGMNLIFNIPDLEMGYPIFKFQKKPIKLNEKILVLADSYYWGLFNWGLSKNCFNDGQFWFYGEQIYPESYDKPLMVNDIHIPTELEKNKVVLLISTDANLFKFHKDYIDKLYDAYFESSNMAKNRKLRIDYYINVIKHTPEWLLKVKDQVKREHKSLEQAILENAQYMVWLEDEKK